MVLLLIFVIGYSLIIFEQRLKINKSAIALATGTLMWLHYFEFNAAKDVDKYKELLSHLSDISQVIFFLLGAMTIVELISVHRGFEVIQRLITVQSSRKLFWVFSLIGFWTSSILDNLTTILVLISLLRKIVKDNKVRMILAAGLVFVVNTGGVWTPIGSVTTTMLWIEGRVNTLPVMANLFVPSLFSLFVFTAIYSRTIPDEQISLLPVSQEKIGRESLIVLFLGVAGLIMVPVFKIVFNLPPFMGMMISLGVLWLVTDIFHRNHKQERDLKVEIVLTKIDISCIMFFMGILLAVDCLESAGILQEAASNLQRLFHNVYYFNFFLGVLSAIVDNIPLMAGVIEMFSPTLYLPDHVFWNLSAYCTSVGGTLLIIGSAPGVVLMNVSEIKFSWYFKKVSWIVLVSYVAGLGGIYAWERFLQ